MNIVDFTFIINQGIENRKLWLIGQPDISSIKLFKIYSFL